MAKEANKALIGAFVLGAVALSVVAILAFGGGKFFEDKMQVVTYFDGSVKGLGAGSKVQMKGVTIGQVKDIRLMFNPDKMTFISRVLIESEPDSVTGFHDAEERGALLEFDDDLEVFILSLVNLGLRAKLELDSILTGKLLVSFGFYPETEAKFRGVDQDLVEIPTIQTEFEKIAKALDDLPLEKIVFQIQDSLAGINEFIRSPDLKQSVTALNHTLQNTESLTQDIKAEVGPVLKRLDQTLDDYRTLARNIDARIGSLADGLSGTARDARKLVNTIDGQIPGVVANLDDTLKQARLTLKRIEDMADDDSQLQYGLNEALTEVERAARSIRQLADYLSNHPESLIRGRSRSGGR
jgi:paraquat-inducible protein B